MRLIGCLTLTAAVLAVSAAPATASTPDSLNELVDYWSTEIGAPGMAARIVEGTRTVHEATRGVDGRGEPIGPDTPFVWGSVSKQFAAATFESLVAQGRVAPDAPVTTVLPESRALLPDSSVTVADLKLHRSGLPHDTSKTDDWDRRSSATAAVAAMARPQNVVTPGSFRYSSLNYLLLQAVIEKVTNEPYAAALRRAVLDPADASDVITDPDTFVRDIAPGYVPFFGTSRAVDIGVDTAGLGYGYLAGSTDALARYASWRLARLQNGEIAGPKIPTGHGTTYGAGLYRERIRGHDVWWHSGAVPGYYTYVEFIPHQNKAVVLATNRYGEIEADRIAAVGRDLTTRAIDGTATPLPRSPAALVLGGMIAAVGVLLIVAALLIRKILVRRPGVATLRGTVIRVGIIVTVSAAVAVAAITQVPTVLGASLPVMWRWVPDVTLMFWALLTTLVVTAMTAVAHQVSRYRHAAR